MILSVHLANGGFGPPKRAPAPEDAPGLLYAETMSPADLGNRLPVPKPGRLGMVAAWEEDAALDAFLADHKLGRRVASGWHVRLRPLRASGSWSRLPALERCQEDGEDDEPVAVITLGRLRLSQGIRFLRTSRPAEKAALGAPGLLASTGMARPPLVCTFSLWRSVAEMRDYAYGGAGESHVTAIREHQGKPFHKESIFARFQPYLSAGEWDGRDPLADVVLPARGPAVAS